MAISSTGIGSGLDVGSIITQLTALERRPLVALQTKAQDIQARLSAVGQIKSQVSALSDAAFALQLDAGYGGVIGTSSNASQVSVTAITGTAETNFSVEVSQLAKAQSVASTAVVKDSAIGTGTLTIDIGTWNHGTDAAPLTPPTFTQGSAASVSITIGAGENTLTAIAQKINDSNSGVVATILRDNTGERLLVRSKATGENAGFRIQATDADGINNDNTGLSSVAFDLQVPSNYGLGANAYQRATDSLASINGVQVRSSTNTVTDAVPGITLQLAAVTTAPIDIRVARDNGVVSKNINAFVAAYNALNKTLADSTKYDADTKTAGVLQGDSAIVGLRNILRTTVTSTSEGSSFSRLSDIGLTVQLDGSIAVNSSKLTTALADPTNLKNLFAIDNSNGATNGIARKVKTLATTLLDTNGGVTNAGDALQIAARRNLSDQDKVNAHVLRVGADLKKKYSALDGKIAGISSIGAFVAQWVTQSNRNN